MKPTCRQPAVGQRLWEPLGFFTYYLCHIFFTPDSSFFIIFVMEAKALGRLHFKYYAEVEEPQRMCSKTSQVPEVY